MATKDKAVQEKLGELLEMLSTGIHGKESPWGELEDDGIFGLIQGVAVPISVSTPRGRVRCYLSFPADVVKDGTTLVNVIGLLVKNNVPVDFFSGGQAAPGARNWMGNGASVNGGGR